MNQPDATNPHWQPWQKQQEREDFFDAVARRRRTAWRVMAVCGIAYVVLAVVMSLLLAPLLYGIMGLVLDLLNLLFPTPDLLAYAGGLVGPIIDNLDKPEVLSNTEWTTVVGLASLPGLVLMALVARMVARAVGHSALFDAHQPLGCTPASGQLNEVQFANVLEEMAIAALIPPPRVVIVSGGANAAAVGWDSRQTTVVVGDALLGLLNRQQMQGIAAHLIAAIADDDMKIGRITASVLGVFALLARLSFNLMDRDAFASNARIIRALALPTTNSQAVVLTYLGDPFTQTTPQNNTSSTEGLGWKEWLLMPLIGPVWFSGFLGALVSTMLLTPVIGWAWQQRKYMADATAVRLTREADGLSTALATLGKAQTTLLAGAWANHLCVLAPQQAATTIVPTFPSVARRLQALARLGGSHQAEASPGAKSPLWVKLLLGSLLAVIAVLMAVLLPLLVMASTMMTLLFTVLPVAILHGLLR